MKKILPLLIVVLVLPAVAGGGVKERYPTPIEMGKKDIFQAEQWIRIARGAWYVGDYPGLRYTCQKIIDFYPGTIYALEAEKFMRKSDNPKKNRGREYRRDNPALFPR